LPLHWGFRIYGENMRRPLDGARRITGNAASHAKYGVGPATDYGADSGEPIHAPFKGWVTRWWSDSGGYSVAITTDWVKFTIQHLSAYAGKSSGQVNEGEVIGYVGNTGSRTEGPHVHCWIILTKTGERISFEQYLVDQGWTTAALENYVSGPFQTSTASLGSTPFPQTELETGVRVIKNEKTGEHARLGEFSVFMMNAAYANNEAGVWNAGGKHEVLSDEDFKRCLYLAEENGKRLVNAISAGVGTTAPPEIDYKKLALLIKVPTAAENGAAARTAIVKS
jgi:murein DD-endopeptidase MepM/ murein hydrolase activator NlpD